MIEDQYLHGVVACSELRLRNISRESRIGQGRFARGLNGQWREHPGYRGEKTPVDVKNTPPAGTWSALSAAYPAKITFCSGEEFSGGRVVRIRSRLIVAFPLRSGIYQACESRQWVLSSEG